MTIFAPNRTKYLLSGDGWAHFEVFIHGEPLEEGFKVQRFRVMSDELEINSYDFSVRFMNRKE